MRQLKLVMRRFTVGLVLVIALGCAGCMEVTAFCLSAGAPDGVRLVLTSTPTGYQCRTVVTVDTLPSVQPSESLRNPTR